MVSVYIPGNRFRMRMSLASLRSDLQHAIRFLPVQFILNVRSGLGLDHEADQTE